MPKPNIGDESGVKPPEPTAIDKEIVESKDKIKGGLRGDELKAESERLASLLRKKKEILAGAVEKPPTPSAVSSTAKDVKKENAGAGSAKKSKTRKKQTKILADSSEKKTPIELSGEVKHMETKDQISAPKAVVEPEDVKKETAEQKKEIFEKSLEEFLRKHPREKANIENFRILAATMGYDPDKIKEKSDSLTDAKGMLDKRRKNTYDNLYEILTGSRADSTAEQKPGGEAAVEIKSPSTVEGGQMPPVPQKEGGAAGDGDSKMKKFLEENKLNNIDDIKRELGAMENMKTWDADAEAKHEMLVNALRRQRRFERERPETLDKEIAKFTDDIAKAEAEFNALSEEERGNAEGQRKERAIKMMKRSLELRKRKVETGKELMVIRDRVIAEMAQGKSLAERQKELEALDLRSPKEQAELDYIIRGGNINAIIQIFVSVEGKDSKEYWEKYGASFFEGYEEAVKNATDGGVKEPDAEKFGMKLLEYLPDEGNPKMTALKKGGGEALKKITDAIGEIFKEKDTSRREEKSGESKELRQIKNIMGEDRFKEFMKTLFEAKERKEKGELTPEEAAKQKEKLEKAKGTIGGSMEKAWSIAGLVGIMLLLGLIFMIIVELEAIDFMLKKTKGGKGGIF